jgi:DNA-binding NarL/FixJ family response regulator
MATTNSIFIQIDNERIELVGSEKQSFLADLDLRKEEAESDSRAKAVYDSARESALAKLAALGLTDDEIAAL